VAGITPELAENETPPHRGIDQRQLERGAWRPADRDVLGEGLSVAESAEEHQVFLVGGDLRLAIQPAYRENGDAAVGNRIKRVARRIQDRTPGQVLGYKQAAADGKVVGVDDG